MEISRYEMEIALQCSEQAGQPVMKSGAPLHSSAITDIRPQARTYRRKYSRILQTGLIAQPD
jgi:hypothetical protein